MSHRIDAQGARAIVQGPVTAMDDSAAVLDTVHAFYCSNPLCSRTVSPTREWHRYCSAECRQQASLIHRVAKLLTMLSDEEVITVLRGPRVVFADFARPNRPTSVT